LNENIIPHTFQVTRDDRSKKLNQNPCLIWYTGLSGSGKSTLANAVEKSLFDKGFLTYSLDGDNVRNGISNNLDFSAKDRSENIGRIAEVAKLMIDAGLIVSASFVSPFEEPKSPDLSIDTTNISIGDASKIVLSIILKKIAK